MVLGGPRDEEVVWGGSQRAAGNGFCFVFLSK